MSTHAWLVGFSRGVRDSGGCLMLFDAGIYEGGTFWKELPPELVPERGALQVPLGRAEAETFADARDKLRISIPNVPMWTIVLKCKTYIDQLVPRSVSSGARLVG